MNKFIMHLLLYGVGLGVVMASLSLFFRVTTIECNLDGHACAPEVKNALSNVINRSLFFTHFEPLVHQGLPNVTLRSLEKKLPSTVVFHLASHQGLYSLQFKGQDQVVNVDDTGRVVTGQENRVNGLKIISQLPSESVLQNDHIRSEYHTAFTQVAVASRDFSPPPIEVILENEHTIHFVFPNDIHGIIAIRQVGTDSKKIALILQNLEALQLESSIRVIDARYRLPVLRTNYYW